MSIKIKEIENKETWDNFITSRSEYTFLHSWAWGELNEAIGDTIWRLGFYENEKLIATALVIKVHARRGNFLFVPHGPIFNKQKIIKIEQILKSLTEELKKIAEEEKDIIFVRISPFLDESNENKKIFKDLGFRDAPIYMHAETTWTLALNKEEKELMLDMRKNTRNLIRRAEKEGVEIISGTSDVFISEFYALYKRTAKKQGFVPFSKKYIQKEINAFEGATKIYLAKWQDKILSSAVIAGYGNSSFYHHGANSSEHRKIPAAYLLQWQIIKDAKEQGRAYYNFWGIAKNDENKKHPWYGLSFFKKGFGGYRTDYLHAQDLPLKWNYVINYVIEKIRLWKRKV